MKHGKRLGALLATALVTIGAAPAIARTHKAHKKHHAVHCRVGYVRKTVWVPLRRHGHVVRRDRHVVYVPVRGCVKKVSRPVLASLPPQVTATHAALDPSFTQSPTDPLDVTFSYGATDAITPTAVLPAGTLSLSAYIPDGPPVGGCEINVGGSATALTGGTCAIELPALGTYDIIVSYTGASTTVAPSSTTYAETILPFPTTTNVTDQTSGTTTTYNMGVVDQNSNPVTVTSDATRWVVTDTTTGQTVGTYSNVGTSASFYEMLTGSQGSGFNESICTTLSDGSRECGDWINTADSFSVQASYAPTSSALWTGSTSSAIPLATS